MSLTRLILRFAAPVPQVASFGRYLFIGPHPDDIEIGAGATAAKLAEQGKQVCFLVCTDGRYGDAHAPCTGDALAELRRREAVASAAHLGVTDVRFLNLSDGAAYRQEDLLSGIAAVIAEFQPDIIFAPDPCVRSECHADHLNVGRAVRRLACAAPNAGSMAVLGAGTADVKAVAFYMTARPNRFVGTRRFFRRQLEAIALHQSQFPSACPEATSIPLYLTIRSIDFGLRSFRGRAEGFRVLGQTHMHCLPEAE